MHWYDSGGNPVLQVHGKPVGMKQARELNLYPSVTGVIDILKNEGLELWKRRKLVDAARDLENRSFDDILEAAAWESTHAMTLGSAYHKAMEIAIPRIKKTGQTRGEWIFEVDSQLPIDVSLETMLSVYDWYKDMGFELIAIEKTFTNKEHGYGGMVDLIVKRKRKLYVIDWKTQGTDGRSPRWYKEWAVQLSAYAHGLCVPNAELLSVVLSTTDPGYIRCRHWSDIIDNGYLFDLFKCLLTLWKSPLCTNYNPKMEE